MDPRFY